MRRSSKHALFLGAFLVAATLGALPVEAKVAGSNGLIVFDRADPSRGGARILYTVRPNGTGEHRVLDRVLEFPHWSPDGTLVAALGSAPDGTENRAAIIVDPRRGVVVRELIMPDPSLFTACPVWTPDGTRLVCEGLSDDGSRNGIYTIRASDGGGLTQITSIPNGDDGPGDFSPDGQSLVFARADSDGNVGLFVQRIDGTGLHPITPADLQINFESSGSWSPVGNVVVFQARRSADDRFSIWTVHADGSDLHELIGAPACGGLRSSAHSTRCSVPSWSPDGRKIVFSRASGPVWSKVSANLYTANADGSGLTRVTRSGLDDDFADWGAQP